MRRESGLTLVEMLVTLVISGIFMLIVGFMLTSSYKYWIKAGNNTLLQENMRYARRRITWLVRNADATPMAVNAGRDTLTFNPNDKITIERHGNAIDGYLPSQVVYYHNDNSREVILTSVTGFAIYDAAYLAQNDHVLEVNRQGTVMFSIEAKANATNNPDDGVFTSSMTFIIKNTNIGT